MSDQPTLRRGYVNSPWGQLHYTQATPSRPTARTPLVMLHGSPFSSKEYAALLPEMGRDRVAIAFDNPGAGGSDGPGKDVTLEEYAGVVAGGINLLGYGPNKQIDLLGNLTGSSIATEIAIAQPKMVRHLILPGVLISTEEQIRKSLADLSFPESSVKFFEEFSATLLPRYAKDAPADAEGDRIWGEMIADSLRPVAKRETIHVAAYNYGYRKRERMSLVTVPVILLATGSFMRASTLAAKGAFKNETFVDVPQFRADAFRTQTQEFGAFLREYLD